MTKLDRLVELGQSAWLDYLRRAYLESGQMQERIDQGVRGVTSNPSIFNNAISKNDDYDHQIAALVSEGKDTRQIYEALVVQDIQRTCDLFRPTYDGSGGADGYVSLEASPSLARDTEGTIEEVTHFHQLVNRPNLMIKIPATKQGFPAIQEMLSRGVNINITLMFSLSQYDAVAEAYLSGLEAFKASGGDPSKMASVASFFVSRVDTKVDKALDELGVDDIRGEIGIANAKAAYRRFRQTFKGERWQQLADDGARVQRVLWGSTSTKDPSYPDTMYVDNLIGPDTINTAPPETLDAFIDHGTAARTVDQDLDQADAALERLAEIGIEIDQVTDELLEEGLVKFSDAFDNLTASIRSKADQLRGRTHSDAGS
ncbi:MAG: transaldolase [Anaerolineales bacterium]